MRIVLCASVLILAAGAASAKQPTASNAQHAATNATQASQAARVVYICDKSAMTRRGFAREFGSVEFVTADDARARAGSWSAPKCMNSAEARRLQRMASAN